MYSARDGTAIELLPEPFTRLRFPVSLSIDYHSIQLLVSPTSRLINVSYSTCLGRVDRWKNLNKLGFTNLQLPERMLELLKDDINGMNSNTVVSSNGSGPEWALVCQTVSSASVIG